MRRNKTRVARASGFVMAVTVAGCDSPVESLNCPDVRGPGVTVEAVDAVTTDAVTQGLSGIVIDGDDVRTMEPSSPNELYAFLDAGIYSVVISADGYEPWAKTGIEVVTMGCTTINVPLTAEMVARAESPTP